MKKENTIAALLQAKLISVSNFIVSFLLLVLFLLGKMNAYGNTVLPPAIPDHVIAMPIKGLVVNEKGEPLEGVSVMEKGTGRGTMSQTDGTFAIDVKNNNAVLVFSRVGYISREIPAGNKDISRVVLLPVSDKVEEEVVVIGYGSVKKKDLTSSVAVLDPQDLAQSPVSSFVEALSGKAAGVQVNSIDGQPGGEPTVIIRGIGSLNNDLNPLFVIDGFPMEDFNPHSLNMNDIQTINILKDASATAIYGSRAANGVIVIETKKGKIGKPVISLNASVGLQSAPRKVELMSPYEYVKYQLEAFPDKGGGDRYLTGDKTLDDYKNAQAVNMQDLLFHTGSVSNYNLAVRGGNAATRYSLSGSLFDQDGIIVNTGMRRYTTRLSLDQTINSKLKVGVISAYSNVRTNGQPVTSSVSTNVNTTTSNYIMYRAWGYRPVPLPFESYDDFLNSDIDEGAVSNSDVRVNPVTDLKNIHYLQVLNGINLSGYLDYTIIKNLKLRVTGGINQNYYQREQFYNSKTARASPVNTFNVYGIHGSIYNRRNTSWFNDNTLTYNKKFNKVHDLTIMGLVSFNKSTYRIDGYSSKFVPTEGLGIDGIDLGTIYDPIKTETYNALQSVGGRIDYNYASKYMVTLAYRRDGSTKFMPPHQWGSFPAVAVAWNMQNEKFLKKSAVVSTSKLRASYGLAGNNRVPDFEAWPSITIYDANLSYPFNNNPIKGSTSSSMGNADLTWERSLSFDVGYELGLLKDRLEMVFEYYRKDISDLLLSTSLPPTSGYVSAYRNIGKISNRGFEFTFNSRNIRSESFEWRSNFNITFNSNKILGLADNQYSLQYPVRVDNGFTSPLYINEVGQAAGRMMGYVWLGNYQYEDFENPYSGVYILKSEIAAPQSVNRNAIQPGDVKYKDMNGDGVVNEYDMTVIGRGQPVHTGGFSNNFSYKNFSLGVFLDWVYGNNIYNGNRITFEGNPNGRMNLNQYASYVNRWTPENPTNENWRSGGSTGVFFHSSKYVEDGSFLRMKTVSLDYAVPQKWCNRIKVKNIALNVSIQNLFVWTKYSGLDPDVSVRVENASVALAPGYDYSAYPHSRTIVFGIKATL